MKGTITIQFNQATMIEAVQMYLDAQMLKSHVVKSVKATPATSGYSEQGCFDIEFSEAEQK